MGLRQKRTVMLAGDWNASMDPRGWLVSEKFNGWRAEFDGTYLRSSSGRVLDAPGSLLRALPPIRLDGELWLGRGRGNLQDIGSIVAHATDPRWGNLFYVVFDTPDEMFGSFFVTKQKKPQSYNSFNSLMDIQPDMLQSSTTTTPFIHQWKTSSRRKQIEQQLKD